MQKYYLHVDLDAFFASVEQLDNPHYRGKPVIVGGEIGDRRAVVSTASYEARQFGIHAAMSIEKAVQLCPSGIFIRGRMSRYHQKSQEVMEIFKRYSPDVVQMSVDEAFIDLTGTEALFGSPVETAKKIKQLVKEETGLTVSIGIASTKYVAKIASGYKKPDGLFFVPHGSETDFMMSLPLSKVWGIGENTLKRLNTAGIKTTKALHDTSMGLLESIFGKASALFLYQAVRGGDDSFFDAPAKTHQISSENTYCYDLYTPQSIDTALMELCHTVMFRLHRQQLRSKSVALKIRYEDFTTVSIQETSDRYILSIDDLFERSKRLFYKKYDHKKGIRLLGVGLQNVEDASSPVQKELFDTTDQKKKKIEEAILKAKLKNPDINIIKARLLTKGDKLKTIVIASVFALLLMNHTPLSSQSPKTDSTVKADAAGSIIFDTSTLPVKTDKDSVFSYDIDDKNIKFMADGYWQTTLKQTAVYTNDSQGEKALNLSTPLFIQNVDLSLLFSVKDRWFFTADFQDEFETNTITLQYKSDDFIREGKISNRNIVFPSFYSVEQIGKGIAGGNNQAPGFYINTATDSFRSDTVIRYDMLTFCSKSWYGKNCVNDSEIILNQYVKGQKFVLQDSDTASSIKNVYVQSPSGSFIDNQGKKYKKLDTSQYLIIPSQNAIILSKDAKSYSDSLSSPAVALSFYKDIGDVKNTLGSYKQSDGSDGKYFLGSVQKQFTGTNLGQYSYGGLTQNTPGPDKSGVKSDGFFSKIDGEDVMFVQHPSGFSPFIFANTYDLGIGEVTDVFIQSKTSGVKSKAYSAVIIDDEYTFTSEDFFSDSHIYATVYCDEKDTDITSPKNRYPLSLTNPEIYLNTNQTTDLILKARSYEKTPEYNIGTKAVSESVTVYKNNISDDRAKYKSETGAVTLSTAVSDTDHIYITWYEQSASNQNAAIAFATGAEWDINDRVKADLSFATKRPLDQNRYYTTSDCSYPLTVAFANKIQYKNEDLFLSNISSLSYENPDTTGIYRILSMDEQVNSTVYLSKKAASKLNSNITPHLNERPSSSPSQSFEELSQTYKCHTPAYDGITDKEISGYAIPVTFDFDSATTQSQWAALSISLGSTSQMCNAQSFEIALKTGDTSVNNYKVYLQLGVKADEDNTEEDTYSIPTWLITQSPLSTDVEQYFDPSSSQWQIVKVNLTDYDRSHLVSNTDARLIITSTSQNAQSNTIYAGPYQIKGLSFTTTCSNLVLNTNTEQLTDSTLSSKKITKLNTQTNYIQSINWTYYDNTFINSTIHSEKDYTISSSKYFSHTDLSKYKEMTMYINFGFENKNTDTFCTALYNDSFICINLTESGQDNNEKPAIKLKLTQDILTLVSQNQWHIISIDMENKKLSIDNTTVPSEYYTLYIKDSVEPNKITIDIKPLTDTGYYEKGQIKFDEVLLEQSHSYYNIKDKTDLKITKEYDNKSFFIESQSIYSSNVYKDEDKKNESAVNLSSKAGFTLNKIKTSGDINLSSQQSSVLTGASHTIESTDYLFDFISFCEDYNYQYADNNSQKKDTLSLNVFNIVTATAQSDSQIQSTSAKQANTLNTNINTAFLSISNKLFYNQTVSSTDYNTDISSSYFEQWQSLNSLSLSKGKASAKKRVVSDNIVLKVKMPLIKAEPNLSLSAENTYKTPLSPTYTDKTTTEYSLPFSLNRCTITFKYAKTMGGLGNTEKTSSYFDDAQKLFTTWKTRSWYFNTIILDDFFSERLTNTLYEQTKGQNTDLQSLYYSTSYSSQWKRSFFGSIKDFYIPYSFNIEAERDIKTAGSITDIYQIKANTQFTAVNMFGSTGVKPLFNFYRQDEYISSAGITLKFPKENVSDIKKLYTLYIQTRLLLNESDWIKNAVEGSFETKKEWEAKYTLAYCRKTDFSLVTEFAKLLYDSHKDTDIKVTDSINLKTSNALQSAKVIKSYDADYKHQTDIKINRYTTINTSEELIYNLVLDKTVTVQACAAIGCTIAF